MSVNLSITVFNWLRELKIPVSKSYLKQQLLSHPDYPSLLSITDTLNELGIENTAVQIEKDQLTKLPAPFLAHLNGNRGEFTVINNKANPDHQVPGFFNRWQGVVIAAAKSENWYNKLNAEWLSKELKKSRALLFTLTVLAFFVVFSVVISFDGMKTGLLLNAVAGILVSWLIVSKELGIENKIADQVCGKQTDCNAVIQSVKAKLPFGIGWSDAGIIYFPAMLMSLLIASFGNALSGIFPLLVLFATISLPLTLVSIYYQWRVIKKWCRLCLVTVALLWLQFFTLLPQVVSVVNNGFGNTNISEVLLLLFILFINTAAWLWLKLLIKETRKLKGENFEKLRFKNNPEVFAAILEKQKKLSVDPSDLGIKLGNPNAVNTIIKVCNPYCGPCAQAHSMIEKLLEENDNLQVQILFTATDDEKDIKAKPVKHLMALYEKNDKQLIKKALDDWYLADKKDYDLFKGKYALNGEIGKQGSKLEAMKAWCDKVKIEFTPTFFVNGYQLPKEYSIKDVKYFLEK